MAIGHQLAFGRQAFQRLAFENAFIAAIEIIEDAAIKDEKAGVDPAIEHGLFVELLDAAGAADVDNAVAGRRPHRGERRLFAVHAMKRDDFRDVDVGQPVAVGDHKGVGFADMFLDAFEAAAGHVYSGRCRPG